jgi:hypothetical protein
MKDPPDLTVSRTPLILIVGTNENTHFGGLPFIDDSSTARIPEMAGDARAFFGSNLPGP